MTVPASGETGAGWDLYGILLRGAFAQHRMKSLLCASAIALGVALGYAIQLINGAAISELAHGAQVLSGDADLAVIGPRTGFDESVYPTLARQPEVVVASPVVEVDARLTARDDALRLVGIDVFAAGQLQPGLVPRSGERFAVFRPDTVFLSPAAARWLGLDSEKRLTNKGVSACATCDGALFRGKPMAVVGGGDTAMEEALFLARFATRVTLVHRRGELRASKIMQERLLANEKIDVAWHSAVDEVLGDEFVTGVRLRDVRDDSKRDLAVDAVFIAIGHQPNTALFGAQLEMDAAGYLKVKPGTTRTAVEGVFACGDVADPTYRQAVTAAGTGCMAAIDAERWLGEHGIA